MLAGPHACRLTPRLDVGRLREDLAALRDFPMGSEESYFRSPEERHAGWRVLASATVGDRTMVAVGRSVQ